MLIFSGLLLVMAGVFLILAPVLFIGILTARWFWATIGVLILLAIFGGW